MKKIFSNKLILVFAIIILLFAASGVYYLVNKKIDSAKSCPKYINCMPGPGKSTACEVPKGCENVTKIAY